MFGCTNKYANFQIEISGESSITLTMNSGEEESEKEIAIKITNAPNEACKVISYSVSKPNIISISPILSDDSNIARFKISALENITSYDPSVTVTFSSAEGNKTCDLTVNVKIPATNFSFNPSYHPYVVADGQDYFINTSSLINFEPGNTTERDVEYSLVDNSLIETYGVMLSVDGRISVAKYISDNGVALNEIKIKATVKSNPTISKETTIKVYRNITADDVVLSFNLVDEDNNTYLQNFTGLNNDTESENYNSSITYLMEQGIMLASNIESQKNIDFGVFLNTNSGLDFNKVEVKFEKTTFVNAIIESSNLGNENLNLNKFKIYSVNPGIDCINITLKYKDISDYSVSFSIPLLVKEYPITLVVNNSDKTSYNIFDYYAGSNNGEAFSVNISKSGAFDKTYRIEISKEDFDKLEVRYQYEILDYETLTGLSFNTDAVIYIKAKTLNEPVNDLEVTFISNVVNENYQNENLQKTIKLNLNPGIRLLSYSGDFADKNELYLENGKDINLNYLINGSDNSTLSSFVTLNIVKGADLIEIHKGLESNVFSINSLNKTGEVILKLYSDNGLEAENKTVYIYNYDENAENNLKLDLSSQNIKKVLTEIEDDSGNKIEITKYYIPLSNGQNTANIAVLNPHFASVYSVDITSEDKNIINVGVVSKDDLRFYITALKKTDTPVKITITITLFNDNENVNTTLTSEPITLEFELNTYYPIESVEVLDDEIKVDVAINIE